MATLVAPGVDPTKLPPGAVSGTVTTATPTPYVISGLKAAQPGNLNTPGSNTLPSSQVAAAKNQVATGAQPPPRTPVTTGSGQTVYYDTGGQAWDAPQAGNQVSNISVATNANAPTGGTSSSPVAFNPNAGLFNTGAGVSQGTLGVGTPTQIASNQQASGMIGNEIGQAQQLYQQNYAAIQPTIQKNQDIIAAATQEEEQLTAGGYSGVAADYSGRMAQLENIKQAAQGNINAAVGNLNSSIAPVQNAFATGIGALTNFQQSPYGQPLFNPVSGQVISGGQTVGAGGGTGSAQAIQPGDPMYSALQQYAQGLANNTIPYSSIPSQITGNPVLNAQLLSMAGQPGGAGATTGAGGFNLNAAIATQQGQQAALSALPGWQGASVAAQGIASQIQQYITANPQLNPSQANFANQINAWAQGQQLSDPTYQILGAALTEWVNTIAPVLGVGGDTTNLKTQIAQGLVNGTSQGQTISQVLGALSNSLATQKLQNYQSGVLGGGVVSNQPLPSFNTGALSGTTSITTPYGNINPNL